MNTLIKSFATGLILAFTALTSAQALVVAPPDDITPIERSLVYSIKPDMRKCASPMCGGYWISPVNKVYVDIPTPYEAEDPLWEPKPIYVAAIDFKKLGLTKDEIYRFQDLIFNGQALIAGYLTTYPYKTAESRVLPRLKQIVATETWGGANTNPPVGAFLDVKISGIKCIQAPCPYFKALKINTRYGFYFHRINFSKAELTPDQAKYAKELMYAGSLVIAGVREPLSTVDEQAESAIDDVLAIRATQVYFPFPVR